MKDLCTGCDKRDNCVELCQTAEDWVSQDNVEIDYHERLTKSGNAWEFEMHEFDADLQLYEMFGGIPELTLVEWSIVEELKLPRQQRQCLYLYHWMYWPQAQIAEELDITQQTVSEHIETAKDKLYFYLQKRWAITSVIKNADLTDKQREVAELYYTEGNTQKQIADKLDISQPMIVKYLKIIIKKCDFV